MCVYIVGASSFTANSINFNFKRINEIHFDGIANETLKRDDTALATLGRLDGNE